MESELTKGQLVAVAHKDHQRSPCQEHLGR